MKRLLKWFGVALLCCCWDGTPARSGELATLGEQHVDLRISYDPLRSERLDLVLVDEDSVPERWLEATNAILRVPELARLALPGDLDPLGKAGDPIWVLPASQREGVLHLGVSAEGNPTGVFEGGLNLQLKQVEGPGHFFLWQAEAGELRVAMNSRDGIDDSDAFLQAIGGHAHADWGFTTSGVYRITFQAVGRRLGESTNMLSPQRTLTFHVLPLPTPATTEFSRWQERHWPGNPDAAARGPESDPDHDGVVNLWEYALGSDPVVPGAPTDGRPRALRIGGGATARVAVELVTVPGAEDIELELWAAERLGGPWAALPVKPERTDDERGGVRQQFSDPKLIVESTNAFYRMGIRLKLAP